MWQTVFLSFLALLVIAAGGPAFANDAEPTAEIDYKALSTLAKEDYKNGDIDAAADKTLQILDFLKGSVSSKPEHQLIFIRQYLDLLGGTPETNRRAALKVQDDFDSLADRTGLGDVQVQDLGFRIVRMLAGRNDRSNVAASYDWLKAAYLRQTDDPWFAIQFDLKKANQMRKYRPASKTKRRFLAILEDAQAIDPEHFVTLNVHFLLAKLNIEIGKTRAARRDLRKLADAWSAFENPPSLQIIQALGMLAGNLADAKKLGEMEAVYEEMLGYKPPNACDPIPIYRQNPALQCRGCGKDGQLLIEYDISEKGLVENVRTLDEDVPEAVKDIMIETMSEWRYYPAVLNGTPTRSEGRRVQFNVIGARP